MMKEADIFYIKMGPTSVCESGAGEKQSNVMNKDI